MTLQELSGKIVTVVIPVKGTLSYAHIGTLDRMTFPNKPDCYIVSFIGGAVKFGDVDIETIEPVPDGFQDTDAVIRIKA